MSCPVDCQRIMCYWSWIWIFQRWSDTSTFNMFYLLSNYSSNFLSIDCLQSMFGHPVKQKETGSPFYRFYRNQEVLQRRVLWETLVGYDERIHFELSFIGLHNNDFEKVSRYRDIVFADHLIFYVYFTVWLQSASNNDLSIVRCIIVSGR